MPKARSVQISLCEQLLSSAPDPVRAQTRPLEARFLLCRECFWAGLRSRFGAGFPSRNRDRKSTSWATFSIVFWSRFGDRNPVPKSGPPNRIYTRRSRFQDRNPVRKSGPQTSPTSIPCVAKIWPRGPDFGTGFLSPNRDPKVVHKVDQDVYFPTSSGCLEDVLFVGILTSPECSGCVLAC